mgnify:CR=1 FL=1
MSEKIEKLELLALTTDIVTSHLSRNPVGAGEISTLIKDVYATLSTVGEMAEEEEKPEPVVAVRKSVHPDYIICLEDGKKLKMLKRHLKTSYDMTRWSLRIMRNNVETWLKKSAWEPAARKRKASNFYFRWPKKNYLYKIMAADGSDSSHYTILRIACLLAWNRSA